MTIELPTDYRRLTPYFRRKVREEYVKLQDGKCHYCKEPLDKAPPVSVTSKKVTPKLYPEGFFNYPVHLHHSHDTGLTIGAVHNYCNAVLFEYHGE